MMSGEGGKSRIIFYSDRCMSHTVAIMILMGE